MNNTRLLKALAREPVDRAPMWLMRQAGRYLPEYQALRKTAKSFLTLCQTPELAARATMQPIERYDQLDAAILFSDILTVPDAMGLGLYFEEGIGPRFRYPVQSEAAVKKLFVPDPVEKLGYVLETIKLTKHAMQARQSGQSGQSLGRTMPLIGFSGSPWTIAAYMIEGGPSKHFTMINRMRYARQDLLKQILSVLTNSLICYLNAQIAAGVDCVMIFDTWGGVLSDQDYETYSLSYLSTILASLNQKIPTILFTKNSGRSLEAMVKTGCSAVALDWTANIIQAQKTVGDRVALQGNIEPSILYGSKAAIENQVKNLFSGLNTKKGYIFNLGHGVYPDIDPEKVATLLSAVERFG